MDGVRLSSHIMTFLQKSLPGTSPHRELFVDFMQGSILIARIELFGHYYLNHVNGGTKQEFTFSSQLTPYDHAAYRQFVNDVKARRESSFNFDSCAQRVAFSYKSNGVLSFENSHMNNGVTVYFRYTDQIGKDLEELFGVIERYMDLTKEKEILDFQQRIEALSAKLSV